jgi:hypothetical protein
MRRNLPLLFIRTTLARAETYDLIIRRGSLIACTGKRP